MAISTVIMACLVTVCILLVITYIVLLGILSYVLYEEIKFYRAAMNRSKG